MPTLVLGFSLSADEMASISALEKGDEGRTCWRNDPLRMLDFA